MAVVWVVSASPPPLSYRVFTGFSFPRLDPFSVDEGIRQGGRPPWSVTGFLPGFLLAEFLPRLLTPSVYRVLNRPVGLFCFGLFTPSSSLTRPSGRPQRTLLGFYWVFQV